MTATEHPHPPPSPDPSRLTSPTSPTPPSDPAARDGTDGAGARDGADGARGRARRWGRAAAPSAVFLAVRLIGLVVLDQVSGVYGQRIVVALSKWDGLWLLGIAGGGYDGVPNGLTDAFGHRDAATPLAFFPGYPTAVGVVRFVTGVGLEGAGLLVALLAGLFLAHGLARLGELVPGGSRRAGLLLVALVAAAPMGVVWSMTYSEGLFTSAAVWALVAVLRRHWVAAGACCALAGTVRPTGAALLLAVGLALLVAVRHTPRDWRVWAGGALAPLGLLGYLGYAGWRTGAVNGWFALQRRGWNSRFDGGAATLRFTRDTLLSGRSVLEVVTLATLAAGVVLLAVCARRRVPWPLTVYAAGVLVMDLGANGLMNSKARLLLPAVTLLVPVALGLARRRPSTALAVLAAAAPASAWFGAYALTAWPYAI